MSHGIDALSASGIWERPGRARRELKTAGCVGLGFRQDVVDAVAAQELLHLRVRHPANAKLGPFAKDHPRMAMGGPLRRRRCPRRRASPTPGWALACPLGSSRRGDRGGDRWRRAYFCFAGPGRANPTTIAAAPAASGMATASFSLVASIELTSF